MTLRERLGLSVPPKPEPTPESPKPSVPEWVRRASAGRLPVRAEVVR